MNIITPVHETVSLLRSLVKSDTKPDGLQWQTVDGNASVNSTFDPMTLKMSSCHRDPVMSTCHVSLQFVHAFRRQARKCSHCLFLPRGLAVTLTFNLKI